MEDQPRHSLVKAVRAVPGLSALDDETLLELVGDSANLFWPAGSTVFTKGAPSEGLFVVLSGSVGIVGEDGAELAVLGPGEFFGEQSLLLGVGHRHDVQAREDAELMVVPAERFAQLVTEHADAAAVFRRTAQER